MATVEEIKKRDRWACKLCGNRFIDLYVYDFEQDVAFFGSQTVSINPTEDNCVTLCVSCIKKVTQVDHKNFKKSLIKNKIILIGDIHNKINYLDQVLTQEGPFNCFITTGDIKFDADKKIIKKWYDHGYQVMGDDDIVPTFRELKLDSEINGLRIAGLSGMIRSRTFIKDTQKNISFREILYLSHQADVDILVSHQSPSGIINNFGEQGLQELLNYLVPKIYISGHLHKYKTKFHLSTFCISLPMVNYGYVVAYFLGKELRNLEVILKKGKKVIRV